jgi:hypothetical protein
MLCELAEFCKMVAKSVILRMANLRFCEVDREFFGMYGRCSCSGLFFQKTLNIREKIHAIFDRSIKSKLNRRRGFAIVEIIVVVVIISALFTVLVNTLDSTRGRAESGPRQARVMEDAVIFKEEVSRLIITMALLTL